MMKAWEDIIGSTSWLSISLIHKGWSKDRKYRILTKSGEQLLLRLSDITTYAHKKKEYEIIKKYATTGISMSKPVDFGVCNGRQNVYMLLTWVEGQDLEEVLPTLSEHTQYLLGRQAGTILRKIHSIPLAAADRPRQTKIEKKLMQLEKYIDSHVRVANDALAISYVKDNIHKLWLKPPVYLHGDFHPGNLVFMPDSNIGVIDFNRWEVGDRYEEFYKLESFAREYSIPYCIGQIDAYFNDQVPDEFWEVLAVYVAHASLFSIKWAEPFGQKDIEGMVRRWEQANKDYHNFQQVVPDWYIKKF